MPEQAAILLVDHGSRRPEANALVHEVARRLAELRPGVVVEVAHLEVEAPDIAAGVAACVEAGASEITVQPFLLTPGRHSRTDIPDQIRDAMKAHPDVRFRLGEVLGKHDALFDLVTRSIEASTELSD